MLYINEWLPNPAGPDGDKEFVELYNRGGAAVDLGGWSLRAEGGKQARLPSVAVPPGGYLVLKHVETKLSLKNTGGGLSLYGPAGQLIDSAAFVGSAPPGKSFSRIDYGTAPIEHFAFTAPTPGTRNKTPDLAIARIDHPTGVPLNKTSQPGDAIGMLIGALVLIPPTILYVIKKNKITADLFFGRDAGDR